MIAEKSTDEGGGIGQPDLISRCPGADYHNTTPDPGLFLEKLNAVPAAIIRLP